MPDNLHSVAHHIDQVIGQQQFGWRRQNHSRRMVEANRLSSMILYGLRGSGKTSIASAIAVKRTGYAFRPLMQQLTVTSQEMQRGQLWVGFDEYPSPPTKQDFSCLARKWSCHHVIGATTENPLFCHTRYS